MKRGQTKYAGKYLNGDKVGMWTIISDEPFPEYDTFKCYCVKAKCQCGKESIIPCWRFDRGCSKGCQSCRVAGKGSYLWRGVGEISGRLLSQIKNSAKVRGIEYDVDGKYLWSLFLKQQRKCAFTGEPLVFDSTHYDKNTASLDRIDSSKGYVRGNIAWVHKNINMMKHVLSLEDFVQWCEKVYERRKQIRDRDFWSKNDSN